MKIARFINENLHHYFIRYGDFKPMIFTDVDKFNDFEADKKLSYISICDPSTETIPFYYKQIKKLMSISDHVYVDLSEPAMTYEENGVILYTPDFINKFQKTDNVTFFGNIIINVPINRPCHYLQDMFYEGTDIYKTEPLCIRLLNKLTNNPKRKYYWELMCSHNVKLYNEIKKHNVFAKTFTTCHALGITHWGPDVKKPTGAEASTGTGQIYGAEKFQVEINNLRCTDLIDPTIYNESFYTCVVETCLPVNDVFSCFSEKEAKPIVAKRPFIIVGSKDHLKAFRKLGFQTFSPVIDESYDNEPDLNKRFHMIFEAMQKLTQQDPKDVYSKLRSVLEHNHQHFYDKTKWNKELLDAWHQGYTPVI